MDDDLTAASIRSADAYLLMNLPANAPSAPSVLPRVSQFWTAALSSPMRPFRPRAFADQSDRSMAINAADTGGSIDDDGDSVVDGGVGHGWAWSARPGGVSHADIYCARVLDDEEAAATTWASPAVWRGRCPRASTSST
ncbi:MAG: hypothetical protein R3F05_13020 [Planctomycetota bacterium]